MNRVRLSSFTILAVKLCLLTGLPSIDAAQAQQPNHRGTLFADNRMYMWSTPGGDTLRGEHDDLGLLARDRRELTGVFTPDGLMVDSNLTPYQSLSIRSSVMDQESAQLEFDVDRESRYRNPSRWSVETDIAIAINEFFPGSVFTVNASIAVAGEVNGDVIAIGGDVTVREGATVRGAVIVIGGILRQRGDGKIYGVVFAPGGHRRPRLSISRAWEFEEEGFSWHPVLSYDRVDGLRPGPVVNWRSTPFAPRFQVSGAYAFASETWQYEFEVRQRLLRAIDLEGYGAIYRRTDTDDEFWVGTGENTIFAVVAGSDYRDYFGIDGGEIGAVYKYRERGVLSITYRNADYRWLEAEPNLWHLFRPNHDFRSNFSTLDSSASDTSWRTRTATDFENNNSAVVLAFSLEPKDTHPDFVGFNGTASLIYEIAGGGLGGDFDYDRLFAYLWGWWDTGERHQITLRAFYGAGRRHLPPNKLFYLGGVGSLRGYPQKNLVGDEAFLVTFEYRFSYWNYELFDGAVMLFADAGRASNDDDFWDLSEFKSDVGMGLGLGDLLRIDAAKGLDRSDRDIKVTVRITRPL